MAESHEGRDRPDKPDSGGPVYTVQLPCSPDTFTTFISGLLGKPQTIEQTFRGQFEITKADVESIFHLVDQRVKQQNEASLVQFTVKIVYDDGSSVLLNSLAEFLHYTEVRPIVSTAVHLSWTYLIKFQDKSSPEKQEIELSFSAQGRGSILILRNGELIDSPRVSLRSEEMIFLRIRHTARTWGVDLESLVSGQVKGLLQEEPTWKRLLYEYSERVGLATGLIFFVIALIGVFVSTNRFVETQMGIAQSLMTSTSSDLSDISKKLNFIIERAASGEWTRFIFASAIFVVLSLIASLFLGIWSGVTADNRPSSFILLSRRAEENKRTTLEKQKRQWLAFGASVVSSVVTGFISNILFTIAYVRWLK
jgi:hypothetical protein